MPTVSFTANLRRHLPVPDLEVEGATVRDAFAAVFALHPQLRSYLVDEQDRLRKHVNVFVNGAMIKDRAGLSDPLAAGDKVWVMQALSGG
jgi:molybdopterin synthase sulfur carrier subunit